jgi:hypothetical protein
VPFDEDAVALAVFLAALEGGLALVDDADAEAEGPVAVMVSRGRGGLKGRRRRFWVPCRSGGIFIEYLITGSSCFFLVICVCFVIGSLASDTQRPKTRVAAETRSHVVHSSLFPFTLCTVLRHHNWCLFVALYARGT